MIQTNQDFFFLGINKLLDNITESNIIQFIEFFKRSSEAGNDYSSYILGVLYQEGQKIRQNINKSIYYYTKSYEQN